jgi:hypothetical protein
LISICRGQAAGFGLPGWGVLLAGVALASRESDEQDER